MGRFDFARRAFWNGIKEHQFRITLIEIVNVSAGPEARFQQKALHGVVGNVGRAEQLGPDACRLEMRDEGQRNTATSKATANHQHFDEGCAKEMVA